jgi:hypothetical protein
MHKRYLSESEIADLYRGRFADARAQADLAESRHRAAVGDLDQSDQAWLVASIQPDRPAAFTITRTSIEPLRSFGRTIPIEFPSYHSAAAYTPVPSFRSLQLLDGADKNYSQTARLHLDGGGSVAYGWEWRPRNSLDEGPKISLIAD